MATRALDPERDHPTDVLTRFRLPVEVARDLLCCIEEARRELQIFGADTAAGSTSQEARQRPSVRMARLVEVHHVKYQSQGGGDDSGNLISLCPFHHRMGEHGEWAKVEGTAPLGLTWRLGHKELGVWYRNERRVVPVAFGI